MKCTYKIINESGNSAKCGSTDHYKGQNYCKMHSKMARHHTLDVKRGVIAELLGASCTICSAPADDCHQVYFQKHKDLWNTTMAELRANCLSGKFARVCRSCHFEAHDLHRLLTGRIAMNNTSINNDWAVIKYLISCFWHGYSLLQQDGSITSGTNIATVDKTNRLWAWKRFLTELDQIVIPLSIKEWHNTATTSQRVGVTCGDINE